LKAKSKLP